MMKHFLNTLKGAAQQAGAINASTRHGTVSSYDPNAYAVKVMLQPDNVETGWLPLKSAWIGNGWGLFCPPSIGDAVELAFQEADGGVGSAGLRFFNDQDRPLPCPSGEFWLVHQSGSLLKFHNDGSVELHTAQDLNATVAGDANVAVTGTLTSSAAQWNHTGPVKLDGTLTVTDVTYADGGIESGRGGGSAAFTGGSVTHNGVNIGSTHRHGGVEGGDSTTSVPQ